MKKKVLCVLISALVISAFAGCGSDAGNGESAAVLEAVKVDVAESRTQEADSAEESQAGVETITEDQAVNAIRKYCYAVNPQLEGIVEDEQYTVYWDVIVSSKDEIVVLYRSYTGAQVRYYIDRATGDTYVTEFVPGITDEEERTEETLNVKDYIE